MRKLAVLASLGALLALGTSLARGDYVQEGKLLVYFDAGIKPDVLPRQNLAPVKVGFIGSFEQLDGGDVPALNTMTLQLARGGVIQNRGLPRCSEARLAKRTTREALAACRRALVGDGFLSTAIRFPDGKRQRHKADLLLFNAGNKILMHVYATEPIEGTFVIPLKIRRKGGGLFGTVLTTRFPRLAAGYGYVTGFRMTLFRTYRHGGRRSSYLAARCPIPTSGVRRIRFELARVKFRFENGQRIFNSSINQCRVRR